MNLHVVAYPELSTTDRELIQAVRKDHNTLYNVIKPHFTIVFSVPHMSSLDFIAEIKKQIGNTGIIPVTIRCAIINKDSFSDYFDAFLVPDEGFSQVLGLHDKLYSGLLARYHRVDISYIPHMSIANSKDVYAIKKIADEWNKKNLVIQGTISSLDIINYENRTITTIEKIQLHRLY